jgi:hypothetical protein
MTLVSQIPKHLWATLIHEMKEYKTFRDGYHQGQLNGLYSNYLSSDSSYRHKFGVLVACFELGKVTDIILDRRTKSVIAYKGQEIIYKFTEK